MTWSLSTVYFSYPHIIVTSFPASSFLSPQRHHPSHVPLFRRVAQALPDLSTAHGDRGTRHGKVGSTK